MGSQAIVVIIMAVFVAFIVFCAFWLAKRIRSVTAYLRDLSAKFAALSSTSSSNESALAGMADRRRADAEALKADILGFIIDHPNFSESVDFIIERLMRYFGCERVVVRFSDGDLMDWWANGTERLQGAVKDKADPAWSDFGDADLIKNEDVGENPERRKYATAYITARTIKDGVPVVRVGAIFMRGPRHFYHASESVMTFIAEMLALAQERARLQRPYQIAHANFETMSKALHELQSDDTLKDLTPFAKLVCERFSADYCSLAKCNEDKKTEVICQYSPSGVSFVPSLRKGLVDEAFKSLASRFEANDFVELDEEDSLRLWRLHGFTDEQISKCAIRFAQFVPIRVHGEFWGAIQIGHHNLRKLSDDEWSHLKRLADILAIAIRRRDRYSELQTALERVEAADKAKFFFSTVSHDIRTPLNAIIGFSQMLKLGFASDAERDSAIESIIVSGKTLLQLINDVLDLSKLESNKMIVSPEPSDCGKIVTEIVDSFRASNVGSPVEIRAKVDAMPCLMIDPQRIRQILFNLVGNAVKFTERGYVEISARFERNSPSDEKGTLRIGVDDTGCGISKEDQKLLASPYVQFGKGVKKKGGTGLGLAICRQLAKAMNGTLNFQSSLGCGSTFSVVLHDVEIGVAAAKAQLTATQKLDVDIGDTAGVKYSHVLVADDSKVNVMVLVSMLKRFGIKDIDTASNGQIAFEKLNARGPGGFDLVLTDMWMPEMDGEALIKAIRADGRYGDLAVYSVTADVEVRATSGAMGFKGTLLKPVTFESLKEILE